MMNRPVLTPEEYRAKYITGADRRTLLRDMRASGFSAQKLSTRQIAEALVQLYGCRLRGVRPSFDVSGVR